MASEWRERQVADLIADGKLVIGDGYRAKNEELSSRGLPFARAGDVNGGFRFADADRFPRDSLDRVRSKLSEPGDVVFTSKGTVGRFGYVRPDTPRFVYSPQLCFWRSVHHDMLHSRFLYYWMSGREFFLQFRGVAGQTDMAEYVSLTDQRRMHITLPPLPEQRAIAHILGTLDDKIELNRRMNETLEAMARALFKSWFVDFDPVRAKAEGRDPGLPRPLADLFPDSFEDSEMGEIPKGWGVGSFRDAVSLSKETENPLETPEVEFSHFSIPSYDDGQAPRPELGEEIKSLKFRVPADAVLMSRLNPEIERVWLADVSGTGRPVCSTEFLVLLAKAPFGRSFVYSLARSVGFRRELQGLVTGTSRSHQRAQPEAVLNLQTIVPNPETLSAFERLGGPLLQEASVGNRESHTLAALRDTLLPKLISGELRVKDTDGIAQELA